MRTERKRTVAVGFRILTVVLTLELLHVVPSVRLVSTLAATRGRLWWRDWRHVHHGWHTRGGTVHGHGYTRVHRAGQRDWRHLTS